MWVIGSRPHPHGPAVDQRAAALFDEPSDVREALPGDGIPRRDDGDEDGLAARIYLRQKSLTRPDRALGAVVGMATGGMHPPRTAVNANPALPDACCGSALRSGFGWKATGTGKHRRPSNH